MKRMKIIIEGPACHECLLGVRRFLAGHDGIDEVEMSEDSMTISYDPLRIRREHLRIIACETLCMFGYSSAAAAA